MNKRRRKKYFKSVGGLMLPKHVVMSKNYIRFSMYSGCRERGFPVKGKKTKEIIDALVNNIFHINQMSLAMMKSNLILPMATETFTGLNEVFKLKEIEDFECSCDECVSNCKKYPGWFAPGEAELAAEHLGVPFEEFKKNLIMDHCDNQDVDDAPYVWVPRRVGVDLPEEEIKSSSKQPIGGHCVFLKNDRCSIHAVKPFECKKSSCETGDFRLRDRVERKWMDAGYPLGKR